MHLRLADVEFDLPDDWRDTTTHQFLTADGSGSLIVEAAHESAPAADVLNSALAEYRAVWGMMIIFSNRVVLNRGPLKAPAVEGEQLAMDQVDRLRFALVGLSSAHWLATLRFLMPSSRSFMPLVQRLVASARFSDESWELPSPDATLRAVQAGPLSLQIPRDWQAPGTFEFQHPSADEVTLTVTVERPLEPSGTIDWTDLIADPFRIVGVTEAPPPPGGRDWESEWQLELSSQTAPWIVKKAARQVTTSTVVTAVLQGPESLRTDWAPVWSRFQSSLQPGFGQ